MAIQNRLMSSLHCDGCEAELHGGQPFRSASEARRAGEEEGWWFPPRATPSGSPSKKFVSDVCPTCALTWTLKREGASRFVPLSEDALRT